MEGILGVNLDYFILTSALVACSELAYFCYNAHIHTGIIRTRISFDAGVGNEIINMYVKCGLIG